MSGRKTFNLGATAGLSGRVKVQVVDARSGQVVEDRPWQRNLILDSGLDQMATTLIADCFLRAAVGTGATPTMDDSEAVTASQTGVTVTLSGTFAPVAAGRLIKWDTGEISRVVSGSGTSWTVTPSQSVASGAFTVYRVDQTQLATWTKNTGTYLTGAANCGTSYVNATGSDPGKVVSKRTFDFSVEVGNQNYTELGFTWATVGTSNPTLFSRILIGGGAVTVLVDQLLRVVYELTTSVSPSIAAEAVTPAITGWPVAPSTSLDGDQRWQQYGVSNVLSTGATNSGESGLTPTNGASAGEPATAAAVRCGLSPSTAALASTFGGNDRQTNGVEVAKFADGAYTPGTFTRTKTFRFLVSNGNRTDYRSLVIGYSAAALCLPASGQVLTLLFDEPQTKDDLHRLDVVVTYTWDRDLS